ncbi:MAG: hypothetical protein ACKV22_23380 [Bryobacteraceae bacterium]
MKREAEFFGDAEMDLVFIAKRLRDALALESALTESGLEYYVEADRYRGGVIFQSERVGAFFYVLPADHDNACATVRRLGFHPFEP